MKKPPESLALKIILYASLVIMLLSFAFPFIKIPADSSNNIEELYLYIFDFECGVFCALLLCMPLFIYLYTKNNSTEKKLLLLVLSILLGISLLNYFPSTFILETYSSVKHGIGYNLSIFSIILQCFAFLSIITDDTNDEKCINDKEIEEN